MNISVTLVLFISEAIDKSTIWQNIIYSFYKSMAYVLTSYGEIVDKYTILEIKLKHIKDYKKRVHILEDLDALVPTVNTLKERGILGLIQELKTVNQALWTIEDQIRVKEQLTQFDEEFIALARSVYLKNDERARLKYKINLLTNSPLIEEKSYQEKSYQEKSYTNTT